jgi:Uma2 family endonuclease
MKSTLKTNAYESLADLLKQLGDIPPHRVRASPPPGMATEKDVLAMHRRTNQLYELVDGVLVEKVMGFSESSITCVLIKVLGIFLDENDLGILAGADGPIRLMRGLIRIPDVSFISWSQLPSRVLPRKPIPDLYPDLAVEILSRGNTEKEMSRKLREYFLAGSQLVWLIDPEHRSVRVYTQPDQCAELTTSDILDGGTILPGFHLSVQQIFASLPNQLEKPSRRRGTKRKPPRRRE